MTKFREWNEPPPMDTGAPMPQLCLTEGALLVAYIVSETNEDDEMEEYAVVKFSDVLQHTFGYPNDEALVGHPIYSRRLQFYAFNEVLESPYLKELSQRNAKAFSGTKGYFRSYRHWIATFHDETLEVIATSVSFLGSTVSSSSQEALNQYVT